jgi:glycosyltransferase involved in cell wall biosynthesis
MAARLDLLHTIAYGPPMLYQGQKLLTVHDLGFRILPATLPARWRTYWDWAYGPAADGCVGWIAVSESTRQDMIRLLHRDPARIHVVHPGVDEEFFEAPPAAADSPIRSELGLPTRFVLHVGTIQPRKDIETLLGTFVLLSQRHADLHLVIAGGTGWGYQDLDAMIEGTGLKDRARRLGYVPAGARPALYRAAEALVFPSLYEGFGLPLVEAMASGLPVVASDVSSIPEVVRDAALLAPPGDTQAFADAVERLLTDAPFRATLIERGQRRARQYRWIDSARRTADVYRDILAGPTSKGTS